MKQGTIEKSAGGVTPEQLERISAYARRPMNPEELYVFSLVLCDNEIDRDCERFSVSALEKLAELFPGKTGIFDHNPSGHNQTARIFRCWVDRTATKTTAAGERYVCLRAEAYMVRSAGNADLILEIDAGIKKEVSVGCSVAKSLCSVCGKDRRTEPCQHHPGRLYRASGNTPCHTVLEEPTDAYEWSFVAVPSQPAAGVTKGARSAAAVSLEPEEALAVMKTGELHLTSDASARLSAYIETLERDAAAGRQQQEADRAEILRLALLCDESADPELLRKALLALSAQETHSLLENSRKKAGARLPLLVQTAPSSAAPQPDANTEFRI